MIYMDYTNEPARDILCIDIKSFFASVEAVRRHLHPLQAYIAVVSRQENAGGLVLAASPRVKQSYGIKTGSRRQEIPAPSKIQIVPPKMAQYLQMNQLINRLYREFVAPEDLHLYSIDESFLDVTHSRALYGSASDIAVAIQREILHRFGLVATIGIGDNPLLAKLALDNEAKKEKPYIAEWRYPDVSRNLWRIEPLTSMWGIGPRTAASLQELGISTVRALSQADLRTLRKVYGIMGDQLFFHAHGIDRSVLAERVPPSGRSFSKSQVLPRDYTDAYEIETVIREMADQVAARLRSHRMETLVVRLSISFSKEILQRGFTHQMKVLPTSSSETITGLCLLMFRRHYRGQPVRMIAVDCGRIRPKTFLQFNLFETPERSLQKEKLDFIVDSIRDRYGYAALVYASSLTSGATAVKRTGLVGGHQG